MVHVCVCVCNAHYRGENALLLQQTPRLQPKLSIKYSYSAIAV